MKTLFLIILLCNFDVRVLYCPDDFDDFNIRLGRQVLNQGTPNLTPAHPNFDDFNSRLGRQVLHQGAPNLTPAHPTDNRKSDSNTKLEMCTLGITALGLFYVYANTQ